MKKRIVSLVLIFVLLCTLSISASAASASESGETSGGPLGYAPTKASLYVYTEHVTAETWCSVSAQHYLTRVTFYYIDGSSETLSGERAVTLYKENDIDVPNTSYATSYHYINAGTGYGTWSTSLRANVW